MAKKVPVVGINFDHMHMGDLLREVHEHAEAEIVGICDAKPERMQAAVEAFHIPPGRIFTEVERCLAESAARPRHPLPRHRRPCQGGRGGCAVGRRHPCQKSPSPPRSPMPTA